MTQLELLLIGFGRVGRGLVSALVKRNLLRNYGFQLKLVGVCWKEGCYFDQAGLDPIKVLEGRYPIRAESALELIDALDYQIMVEATPTDIDTGEPGLTHISRALEHGAHVVTSNKGPLVVKFRELISKAESKGLLLRYEASAGGAMPLINLAREALAGYNLISIKGVLNGTCNYILSRMEQGIPLECALQEAIHLGLTEANPSYDLDGIDTAAKLVIVGNSALELDLKLKDIPITGIREVSIEALKLARNQGYTIRLIGEVSREGAFVAPRLVPIRHPLAVEGSLNAVSLISDLAGEITVTGKGAGSMETACALLSDIIHIGLKLRESS